ncbi:hypothetical protein K2F43_20465 [Clostridium estertheticum]|uniref:hypothetical protein n=1 Tax=Clostridium estertheticum TaxID=238834 RepID=UPI001C6E7746|nr:hypothetical protein [Clostridium estertheticum]MBW9173563.1 hypothetical protein [Clostridium estertheticum]
MNTLLNHTMLTRKKSVTFCVVTFVINSAIVMAALNGLQHFKTNITLFKYGFYFIML